MKTLQLIVVIAAMTINARAAAITPAKDNTQASMLQSQSGKQVELLHKSGGKITFVGDTVVHLTMLTGIEMFEATASLNDVSAVTVRAAR